MNISLVTSTTHRLRHIREFLESLDIQSVPATQIIVVDQGSNDSKGKLVERFEGSRPVLDIRDNRKGLSRSLTGDIVVFPEDDSIYQMDTLKPVHFAFLNDRNLGVYAGMRVTAADVPSQGRCGVHVQAVRAPIVKQQSRSL